MSVPKPSFWTIFWNILLYGSVAVAVYVLHQADYLRIPSISDAGLFALSFPVLFASFLASCRCWQIGARDTGASITYAQAVASYGLPVFAKYLPGKVWVLAGRVAYMMHADPSNSVVRLGAASVAVQLIDIWVAFTLTLIGFGLFLESAWALAGLAAVWGATLVCLLHTPMQSWLFKRVGRLSPRIRKLLDMPPFAFARWFAWFFAAWLLVGLAFYLMASSIHGVLLHPAVLFAMPFGLVVGLLAIIVPGGIGVREGALGACLALAGLPAEQAVSIAAASRLWFMCGEVFLFLSGLSAHLLIKRRTGMKGLET